MFTVKMNDDAVRALGILDGLPALRPPDGLAAGLRVRVARGIVRRGRVLTWADSTGNADGAPTIFPDLTHWECSDSSFHLEDSVPVEVPLLNGREPRISEDDQRLLLVHGIRFALQFTHLVYALDPPSPVRCIVAANETNGTFRFHQIRPGERLTRPDPDGFHPEKVIEIDIEPSLR